MEKRLTPEKLLEIENIFRSKNWEIERETERYASLFNRFCSRCSLFDNEKQDLIIELTKSFLKIGFNDFYRLFISAFNKIHVGHLQSAKRIFILPLKRPNSKETKSSEALWYSLKNYHDFSYERYFNKVSFIDNPNKVLNKSKFGSYLFLFVDDFIGTGETATTIINEILTFDYGGFTLPKEKVYILALIGQNQGINYVHNQIQIICHPGILRFKGITDSYPTDQAMEKIKIMNQIEDLLKIDFDYRLGYGASESLVSLEIKPPNNTFPVYWHETKSKIAPFPRYKRYEKSN